MERMLNILKTVELKDAQRRRNVTTVADVLRVKVSKTLCPVKVDIVYAATFEVDVPSKYGTRLLTLELSPESVKELREALDPVSSYSVDNTDKSLD